MWQFLSIELTVLIVAGIVANIFRDLSKARASELAEQRKFAREMNRPMASLIDAQAERIATSGAGLSIGPEGIAPQ